MAEPFDPPDDLLDDPDGGDPDLEGVRQVNEDVGRLPVPLAVRQQRGEAPKATRVAKPPRPTPPTTDREREAKLRRSLPYAARTPEELGRAWGRIAGDTARDPQAGHEAGPPLPGEPGVRGDS